ESDHGYVFGVQEPGVDDAPTLVVHLRNHKAPVGVNGLDIRHVTHPALPGDHDRARLRHLPGVVSHRLRAAVPGPSVTGPGHIGAAGDVPGAVPVIELCVREIAQVRGIAGDAAREQLRPHAAGNDQPDACVD